MSILSSKTFLMDIETSGLHRENDQIISIGLLYQKETKIQKDYLFIEEIEEEKKVLQHFLSWCQSYDTIVTFHGKGFDYPFLLARLKKYSLDEAPFLRLKLIDTEKILKVFAPKRHYLEKMLGINRQSTSTGQDVAHLYRTYIAYKEPLYQKLILQHQEDELDSLYGTWELYQMLYHLKNVPMETLQTMGDTLSAVFVYPELFTTSFHETAYGYTFSYEKGKNKLTLNCQLITTKLKHPLLPVKDYYYIKSQHQLMHKSLATFVPSEEKRKAKKEECFVEESHTFLQVASTYQLTEQIWQDNEKNNYIIWQDNHAEVLAKQVFYLFFHNKLKDAAII